MTVPCIEDTCTVHLAASGGALTADLLALGFEEDDGGSNITINSISTTAAAPSSSGVVTGATAELEITNNTCYTIAFMALQFASITSASVPAGQVWTLIFQGFNGSSWVDLAQQIFDNSYDGSNPHTFSHGPMVVPATGTIAPSSAADIQTRLYLSRSAPTGGSIVAGTVGVIQFMCIPCL